jgi:hypothetical protein
VFTAKYLRLVKLAVKEIKQISNKQRSNKQQTESYQIIATSMPSSGHNVLSQSIGGTGEVKSATCQQKVGCVMSTVKMRNLTRSNKSGAIDANSSNAEHPDISNEVRTLVSQISVVSTREIDRLISDLTQLRDKLEDDSNRIQADIVEYALLSQSAVQLTKVVSDSVAHVDERSATRISDVTELVIPPFLKQPESAYGD